MKEASSKDGIDSQDRVRVDVTDPWPVSLAAISSSSSGGLSRRSKGFLPSDSPYSFSETPVCRNMASTVSGCPPFGRRLIPVCFWRGMDVMARSAATDGGMASGEWTCRDGRLERSDCTLLSTCSLLPCDLGLSCWPRMGMMRGDDGVVGRDEVSVVVVEVVVVNMSSLSCFGGDLGLL